MSMFSGKCDFYDSFCMIGGDGDEEKINEQLKKLNLFVHGKDGRDHRVKTETIKDIAKYYPYLEAIGIYDGETGYRIFLSSDSFIDQEEREHRNYMIEDVQKYWRKCKRKKEKFDPDKCAEELWWDDKETLKEIATRITQDGNNAEFDDMHFPLWEHYRRRWFEELVRLGYTEYEAYNWCFKGLFDSEEIQIKRLGRAVKR